MPRYPNAAAAFVIPWWAKNGVRAVLLSEQDMCTSPHLFEPALDAFGGKCDQSEDCIKTAVREVWEESGTLIRDQHLRGLHDWIVAQPEDSADVYWEEEGRAVFYFYPIPCAEEKFWLTLNETFAREFGTLPHDPTRKRSPTHLHWVRLEAHDGMPIIATAAAPPGDCPRATWSTARRSAPLVMARLRRQRPVPGETVRVMRA